MKNKVKKKLLQIGGTGFVGTHIKNAFSSDYEIESIGREEIDIRNSADVNQLISYSKPDRVIHLASITTLEESFKNPIETYDITFYGTLNILNALKEIEFTGRMLYVSSSEVYGFPKENEFPITEKNELRPQSPYAVAKIAAEALCYQFSQNEDFDIVIARPFNHIGPGQSERFFISKFAKQIIEMKYNLREKVLYVGELDITRDLADVRDIISAYKLLLEKGTNGEVFNVCSGKEILMRDVLNRLVEISDIHLEIRHDKSLLRVSERLRSCGSYSKLEHLTGWVPKIKIETTLVETLQYWEKIISKNSK